MNSSAVVNDTFSVSEEYLDLYVCGLVGFPLSGIDCSLRQPGRCFKCLFSATYFSGESFDDFQSIGHRICRIIAIAAILISVVGVVTNWLIFMTIRRRRGGKRSFDLLLIALSHVDNLCCISCIVYCAAYITVYDNLFGRGQITLYWMALSNLTLLLLRAISMYLTLVVAIDRYLAIAYPLQSKACYSLGKTKLQIGIVIVFLVLVICPGYFRLYVAPNIYGDKEGGLDVPSLRDFEYMYYPTRYHDILIQNRDLKACIYFVQYWIPVPALLVFNLLTFRQVKILKRKRNELTSSQQKELQPAQMFIPVVIVFLLTNIWPLVMLGTLRFWRINFREVYMSFVLATAVNSSINFWIYYLRGETFRKKTNALLTGLSFRSRANSHFEDSSSRSG